MVLPEIVLVTPALAAANNGNWQTAFRWSAMLRGHYRVRLTDRWSGGDERAMVALHARRSAVSISAWRERHPHRPLVVVLTGTDLYRDIADDAAAQRSLDLADRLVVLNELGLQALPRRHRPKGLVCLQSARRWKPRVKTERHLRVLMVGHLREEKSPQTYFAAARRLAARSDIRLDHIGGGLDPALADQARTLMRDCPCYRWLGELPHDATRRHIAAAHVLAHASRMEGGAHVVIEAVQSGTPVIASRIAGNLGLLGGGRQAYFRWNDDRGLAALLEHARDDPTMLPALLSRQQRRADLFEPAHERATLLRLLNALLP